MYNRCQNVNRPLCNGEVEGCSSSRKSIKLDNRSKHAYPCVPDHADDDASFGKHLDMLASEMAKPAGQQNHGVLKELMKRTFAKRQNWVLHDMDDGEGPVKQIITKYPLLSKAAYVSPNNLLAYILTEMYSIHVGDTRVLSYCSKECERHF